MKATKLTIGFREWSKLPDFVEMINAGEEMFAYAIDNTTAIIVTQGCRWAHYTALLRLQPPRAQA